MTVLIHASAWIVLFLLPILLRQSHNPNDGGMSKPENGNVMFAISLVNEALLIVLFYLNALILIPRFLYKRKYLVYTFSIIFYYAFYVVTLWILWKSFTRMVLSVQMHLVISFFVFVFILACSTAYKTIRDKFVQDRLANEKETEHLKTELSLLRSQASPHFMFNVLNNMVALARKQSTELEPSLIKFSSLMRYMLYEAG
ncbi:MAG: histidine kinase, partial [Ginsengibacter sp.]